MNKESKYSTPKKLNESKNQDNSNIYFNKLVSNLRKIGILTNTHKLPFADYKNMLFKRENILLIKELFELFMNKKLSNDETSYLVNIFIIVNFRKDVLIYNTNLEDYLYQKSLIVYDSFKKLLKNFYPERNLTLRIYVDMYNTVYQKWAIEQNFNIFNTYLTLYQDYEKNLIYLEKLQKSTMNKFLIAYYEKMLKSTIKNASKIIKEFKVILEEFTVQQTGDSYNKLYLEDAISMFYFSMKDDIRKKKYNIFKSVLYDIMEYFLKTCQPQNCRIITNIFNIEEFMIKVESNNMNKDTLIQWINKITERLTIIYSLPPNLSKIGHKIIGIQEDDFEIIIKFFYEIINYIGK